jgi:hypothetical protein
MMVSDLILRIVSLSLHQKCVRRLSTPFSDIFAFLRGTSSSEVGLIYRFASWGTAWRETRNQIAGAGLLCLC